MLFSCWPVFVSLIFKPSERPQEGQGQLSPLPTTSGDNSSITGCTVLSVRNSKWRWKKCTWRYGCPPSLRPSFPYFSTHKLQPSQRPHLQTNFRSIWRSSANLLCKTIILFFTRFLFKEMSLTKFLKAVLQPHVSHNAWGFYCVILHSLIFRTRIHAVI